MSLKEQILSLLDEKVPYNEIARRLSCAKSTVAYHAKQTGRAKAPPKTKKVCTTCGKPVAKRWQKYCSAECRKVARPNHTGSTKDWSPEYRQKRIKRIREWQQKQAVLAKEYAGAKCSLCGYDKCQAALEFHHLDPNEKDFNISHSNKSFESMKPELDKCILVCANCHREIHHS